MIDQIRDFLAAGPERRKAMESAINSGLHKYLGPTGIPQRVGVASEVFNPVVGLEQGGTAARQMMDPRLSLYDRIGAGGRMASEIAGAVAPAGAARLTGIGGDDAARALEEALTGFSARPGAVAAKDFAGDEAGAIRAWHGSPHDFDKFSMDKIGTGEGAQAYGHGLYFAENKDVADAYKTSLTRNSDELRSIAERNGLTGDAAEMLSYQFSMNDFHGQGFDKWLDGIKKSVDDGLISPRAREAAQQLIDKQVEASDAVRAMKAPGKMYEVEIDANPEDFLDWDAPLSEQPEIAKRLGLRIRSEKEINDEAYDLLGKYGSVDAMPPDARARLDALNDELNLPGTMQTGRELYEYGVGQKENVHDLLMGPSGSRSDELRQSGIPGIRYLDQGSRGAGDGTRNYVVFDDNLVSIIKKYGIAGAAGMLGMSASELQAQINQQQPAPLDGLPR